MKHGKELLETCDLLEKAPPLNQFDMNNWGHCFIGEHIRRSPRTKLTVGALFPPCYIGYETHQTLARYFGITYAQSMKLFCEGDSLSDKISQVRAFVKRAMRRKR